MKKSLLLLVALVTMLAFASTASAWYGWDCYEPPKCKVVCKDEVLCKGKAAGAIKLCGPCPPTVTYSGSWLTVAQCPKVIKEEKPKAKPKGKEKPKAEPKKK